MYNQLIEKIVKLTVNDELDPIETTLLLKLVKNHLSEYTPISIKDEFTKAAQLLNETKEFKDYPPYMDCPKAKV